MSADVFSIRLFRCAGFEMCLRQRFQIGQPHLKVFADHFVAIDEQADHFSNVGLLSMHRPRDIGRAALGIQGVLDDIVPLERLLEIQGHDDLG